MPSNTSNESLRFTECANLNTENCPFRTEPEALLSLISDPENFSIINQKVRDLNETCYGCPAFKRKAKQFTSHMVLGKNVLVLPVDEDRYGRIVGWVFIEEINLNKALIRAGLAWHYRQYSSDSLSTALEMEARVMKKGLWSEPDPVPPWEWRKSKRSGKTKFEFSGGISTTIEH